jgi:hypothetical protein
VCDIDSFTDEYMCVPCIAHMLKLEKGGSGESPQNFFHFYLFQLLLDLSVHLLLTC